MISTRSLHSPERFGQNLPPIFLVVLLLLFVSSCSDKHECKLDEIDSLTVSNIKMAKAALDSLSTEEFSEADRQYYDLLQIKIKDKLKIRHTSDSTILSVIAYYRKNPENIKYSEALFYGVGSMRIWESYPQHWNIFKMPIKHLLTLIPAPGSVCGYARI